MEASTTSLPSAWRFVALLMGVLPMLYVLSIGPVLGLAFWLREVTRWGGFYSVIYLYYPLLAWRRWSPLEEYIEWWVVDVFRTVGPG